MKMVETYVASSCTVERFDKATRQYAFLKTFECLDQGSATYDPWDGSCLPSKLIRPASSLQIVGTVWPA